MFQRLLQWHRVRGLRQPVGLDVRDRGGCVHHLRRGPALPRGCMRVRRDIMFQRLLQWHRVRGLRQPVGHDVWHRRERCGPVCCGTALFRWCMRLRWNLVQRLLQRQPVHSRLQPDGLAVWHWHRRGRVRRLCRRRDMPERHVLRFGVVCVQRRLCQRANRQQQLWRLRHRMFGHLAIHGRVRLRVGASSPSPQGRTIPAASPWTPRASTGRTTHHRHGDEGAHRRRHPHYPRIRPELAHGIAVDATSVYWTTYNGGTVMKVSTDGGTPATLASGQYYPLLHCGGRH